MDRIKWAVKGFFVNYVITLGMIVGYGWAVYEVYIK